MLLAWPFLVAASFHYTEWLGWPTLVASLIFGLLALLVVLGAICKFWATEVNKELQSALESVKEHEALREWVRRK